MIEEQLNSEQMMIRYLVGELSDEEQMAIETEYFADPEKFELLQVVEQDMIEGYVSGKLSDTDRKRFEGHYMASPVRRQNVEFFQTLTKAVPFEADQQPVLAESTESAPVFAGLAERLSSWWQSVAAAFEGPRLVFAAAALLLTAGGTWKVTEMMYQRQTPQRTWQELAQADIQRRQMEEQREENGGVAKGRERSLQKPELVKTPAPKPAPTFASFSWTIAAVRGTNDASPRTLRVPPGTDMVRLTFNHEAANYDRYRVTVRNIDGEDVLNSGALKASRIKSGSGSSVAMKVPAKLLQPGAYSMVLSGNNARGEWVEIQVFYIEVE